ncbi:hypothetical protein ICA_00930 [Bacillus cereus BAG1O-3]|nr:MULTISPECIES: hypothetical protein [Bacillus]EPF14528.1 hypothetical protein ICA_00930 [Bacillus cereus BAG1O-3]MDR4412942.1 hypothetical protein [Bacillus thuringiensis]PEQ59126.1 hypothetical protein CN474_31780 [Bacillus thuringiensis]PFG76844.1 hypothetical protein DL97_4097 [Bacillus sp. YF23]PGH68025.1 hypothetical protein CN894_24895 [Bacillus thuringiensis]
MRKITLCASLLLVLFSIGAIKSEAYQVNFSNVYYYSSPIDFTPKAKKYTDSSYGIYTETLNVTGEVIMTPRANGALVGTKAVYSLAQKKGKQTLPNWAIESYGPGVTTDIRFKLDSWPWQTGRSTSTGTWQPDI